MSRDFKVIYVNAIDEDLIKEKSFTKFLKIISSTYNGKPIYARYNITIAIPLQSSEERIAENVIKSDVPKPSLKQTLN
jgi:hypothetical protein